MSFQHIKAGVVRRQRTTRPPDAAATQQFFATTFKGVEGVLADELTSFGAAGVRKGARGVSFRGDLEVMYRANLWSRTAHRILWTIGEMPAGNKDVLYDAVRQVDWSAHMDNRTTFMVDVVGTNDSLVHTKYTALLVKDAIVDYWRDKTGFRPDVDRVNPAFRVNLRLNGEVGTLSWDTSGQRLHRRGYRSIESGPAPLKENLAAAILLLSGYDGQTPLVDPMCGSGTFLVEAALIARKRAPGSLGRRFGFQTHPCHDARQWANMVADARNGELELEGCPIVGYDRAPEAIRMAAAALTGAGCDDMVRLRRQPISDLKCAKGSMVVTNPPYGERLGEINALTKLYKAFGQTLKSRCRGTSAHIITSSSFLQRQLGMKPEKSHRLWNGPLECALLHYQIY